MSENNDIANKILISVGALSLLGIGAYLINKNIKDNKNKDDKNDSYNKVNESKNSIGYKSTSNGFTINNNSTNKKINHDYSTPHFVSQENSNCKASKPFDFNETKPYDENKNKSQSFNNIVNINIKQIIKDKKVNNSIINNSFFNKSWNEIEENYKNNLHNFSLTIEDKDNIREDMSKLEFSLLNQIKSLHNNNFQATNKLPSKIVKFRNESNEIKYISILYSDQLILSLDYIYLNIYQGISDISKSFTRKRREKFDLSSISIIDSKEYIASINSYLLKKEEYFLFVLYEVMSKLNISKDLFDNTLSYYMFEETKENLTVLNEIKVKYEKILNCEKSVNNQISLNEKEIIKGLNYYFNLMKSLLDKEDILNSEILEIISYDLFFNEFNVEYLSLREECNKYLSDMKIKELLQKIESSLFC